MTKPKPQADDPEQVKRFKALAAELEAAGDLNLTDAAKAFDQGFKKMVPAKSRPKAQS